MSAARDVQLEEELTRRTMDFAMLRRLMTWSRPYRLSLVLNFFGTALAILSQLVGPKLIQTGIDRIHIAAPGSKHQRMRMLATGFGAEADAQLTSQLFQPLP